VFKGNISKFGKGFNFVYYFISDSFYVKRHPRRPKHWCHKYSVHVSLFFSFQGSAFQSLLPAVKDKIIESFTPEARDMFEREFDFFDKVTSISGVLFPLPKDERRAGIRR